MWLIVAFAWGIGRLVEYLGAPSFVIETFEDDKVRFFDDGKGDWTFGQTVSVLFLLSPIFTMINYLHEGKTLHFIDLAVYIDTITNTRKN